VPRIPRKDRDYVSNALREIENNPFSGDTDWLKDQPAAFRRRVGNWRILFDLDFKNHVVIIHDIKRRSSKTY